MTIEFPTCQSGDYCKAFETAAKVLIRAKINQGAKYIILTDLYRELGADTNAYKTSVRMARRHLFDQGYLENTAIKGVFLIK
jgi:hypothetical protein